VNYKALSEKIFLLTDAKKYMAEVQMEIPSLAKTSGYKKFSIMGKEFDANQANAYLNSFPKKS
jgi:nitrate/nitrite transport system substrate-binding protein